MLNVTPSYFPWNLVQISQLLFNNLTWDLKQEIEIIWYWTLYAVQNKIKRLIANFICNITPSLLQNTINLICYWSNLMVTYLWLQNDDNVNQLNLFFKAWHFKFNIHCDTEANADLVSIEI